jgi:O-methyltransferase
VVNSSGYCTEKRPRFTDLESAHAISHSDAARLGSAQRAALAYNMDDHLIRMREQFKLRAQRIANSLVVHRFMRSFDGFTGSRFSERGMVAQAFELVRLNQVPGDYLEFGLWRGRTFLHARQMRRLHRLKNMHLWGFDSFQGLPEVNPTPVEVWSTGNFSCSHQEFRSILSSQGVREDEFTLVTGFYDQSLNDAQHAAMAGRKAAVVYIDCDLYKSTVPVLRFIEPYLITGTIVCFDDYYCYRGSPEEGEQRALKEFLEIHPDISFQQYLTYCPAGQSFIVHRR